MLPVARYGVVGELGGCGGSSGGGQGDVDAATAALSGPARDRPDSAGDLRGQRGGGLFDQHAVAAERRQQHPALVAHETHRVERLAARDRSLRTRVEAEPPDRRHVVGRAALLALDPQPIDRRALGERQHQRVAARREGLAHDRAPAARLAGADDDFATAVDQVALAAARRGERGDRVESRLRDLERHQGAHPALAGLERHFPEPRGGRARLDGARRRLDLEAVAGELDRCRGRRQLGFDVDRLERRDREIVRRRHALGLPASRGLDRVHAGRRHFHLAERRARRQQELGRVGARVEVRGPRRDPAGLVGRDEREGLERLAARQRADLSRAGLGGRARRAGRAGDSRRAGRRGSRSSPRREWRRPSARSPSLLH